MTVAGPTSYANGDGTLQVDLYAEARETVAATRRCAHRHRPLQRRARGSAWRPRTPADGAVDDARAAPHQRPRARRRRRTRLHRGAAASPGAERRRRGARPSDSHRHAGNTGSIGPEDGEAAPFTAGRPVPVSGRPRPGRLSRSDRRVRPPHRRGVRATPGRRRSRCRGGPPAPARGRCRRILGPGPGGVAPNAASRHERSFVSRVVSRVDAIEAAGLCSRWVGMVAQSKKVPSNGIPAP
jgi:hypothetical protein